MRRHLQFSVGTGIVSLSLALAAQVAPESRLVARDGVARAVDVTLPRPTESGAVWSHSIKEGGTRFMRLHFTDIQDASATDYTVIIRDFRGTELRFPKAVFASRTDFWTPIVNGDTAQVMVQSPPPDGLRFVLKELAYEHQQIQPLSIFQKDDREPARKYAADPSLSRSAKAVGKLSFLDGNIPSSCTGFLVSHDLFLTNEHCVSTAVACRDAVVAFGYEEDAAGNAFVKEQSRCLAVVDTDAALDFSLLRLENAPGQPDRWGHVTLSNRAVVVEAAYIVSHPGGEPKQFSKISCVIRTPLAPGTAGSALVDFGHECDTLPGSSGAPVFDNEHRVVGLHHLGFGGGAPWNNQNRAVQMREVLARIDPHVRTSADAAERLR